jgi:beta-lactamase class A
LTVINPEERYHPGSLMKVPLMITFLKLEEKKAGWLDKKILINKIENSVPSQTFTSKAIEKGKIYTVRQLLEYMIAYSDNNATWALHQFVDMEEYRNTYRYLNVTVPDFQDPNYTLSPKEFSTLMKVLYNSSYLSNDHSEFAVEMLMKSDFQLGFRKGFPEGTTIAGKFGEWGNDSAGIHELHESGFIYLDGKAYLVTVMTRGSEVQKLPGFIASVSKVIYENLEKGASLS